MTSRSNNHIANLLVLFVFIVSMGGLCFVLINVAYSSENSPYFDNGVYQLISDEKSVICVEENIGRFSCTINEKDKVSAKLCYFKLTRDVIEDYTSNRNEECETIIQSKQEETL